MPRKNLVKNYKENSRYHIFNRGVDGREIFQNEENYLTFLGILKQALSTPPSKESLQKEFTFNGSTFKGVPRQPKNFHGEVELIAFCLVPDSFHLILEQKGKNSMEAFMRSVSTRYSMYFNKKHNRSGSLFQGTYQAVLIEEGQHLQHLSRFIHRKPLRHLEYIQDGMSSYLIYIDSVKQDWVNPDPVLNFYKSESMDAPRKYKSYKDFVLSDGENSERILGDLILE